MEFQLSYFKILRDVVKVLPSICQQIWKTQQRPQDWKSSVFIPIPKKSSAKECAIMLISHASKLCSKSFKQGFRRTWSENFQMYKLGLEKAEEPEINLPAFTGSWRKQVNSGKTSTSASLTTLNPLTVWSTANCGKFSKRWEFQTTLFISWETCLWVKKQQLEPYMEQLTGSKLGKEDVNSVYCHSAYLTYMQSTSCTMLSEWITSCNQEFWEKYQQLQICRKWRGSKEPLDEGERGELKSWLKIEHSKN